MADGLRDSGMAPRPPYEGGNVGSSPTPAPGFHWNCGRDPSIGPYGLVEEFGRPRLPVTEEIAGSNPVKTARSKPGTQSLLDQAATIGGELVVVIKHGLARPTRELKTERPDRGSNH